MHAALYFAIFYMHAIFPLQKTFTFVMRSCVLFFKFFDLFSKTHARFPGFLSRIPLVYNAHQLSFETFNISINISPPDLTAAFISCVESEHVDTEKWPTKSAEQYLSSMSCTVFDHGLRELVKCERIIITTRLFFGTCSRQSLTVMVSK